MKLLSLLFVAIAAQFSDFPGIRTSVSMTSMNSLKSKYLSELISHITTSPISSETFKFSMFFVPAKMTLSNMTISNFSLNQANTNFITGDSTSEIYLAVENLSLTLSANYKYHYPIFSSGTVEIVLNQSSLTIPVKLFTKNGELMAKILNSDIDYSSFKVTFNPSGFISKTFGTIFKLWPIHQIIQHIYKSTIGNIPTKYNKALASLLDSITYDDNLLMIQVSNDFHIFNVSVSPNYININQNGTFYLTNNPSYISPVLPPSFLPNFQGKSPLRIQITEFFFDSFLWSVFESGALNFYVPSESIPSSFLYKFTTTGLNPIIPNLSKLYGPGLPVDLNCSVYKIPNAVIQNSIDVYASLYCDVLIRISPTVETAAFRILTQLQSDFTGYLEYVNGTVLLHGELDEQITQFTPFTIVNSNIGSFNSLALTKAANSYAYYITMQVNRHFQEIGIELPIPKGINLANPVLKTYLGALEIGGDISLS